MGTITCIIFGILTSWLAGSIYPAWRLRKLTFLLAVGIAGGLAGSLLSWLFNIARVSQFNLYSLLFSIIIVLIAMWVMAKRKAGSFS